MSRPAQSELAKLRVAVVKASADELLSSDEDGQTCLCSRALGACLVPTALDSPLSSEHFQLLAAVLKRLGSLVRPTLSSPSQTASAPDPRAVIISESILSSDAQLSIGHHLATGVDSSHRGLTSDAAVALDAFVALAGSSPRSQHPTAGQTESPVLGPLAIRALSSPLRTKPPLALLSVIAPTLSTAFLDTHSPDLVSQLVEESRERHLAQVRGKLLAMLIGHHLDSPASPTTLSSTALQDSLLAALLEEDAVLRLNLDQTTLRPLAEKHPKFIAQLVNRLIVQDGTSSEFSRHERREEAWLSLVTLGNGLSLCGDIQAGGSTEEGKIALPLELVVGCLSHPASAVKLGAFSLVADKPVINSPLSRGEMTVVKSFLEAAINTGESDFRHSIVGRTAKLVVRIKASTFACNRDLVKLRALAEPKTEAELALINKFEHSLTLSRELIIWLVGFLASQIRPSASHARTILSLRLLQGLFISDLFADVPSRSDGSPARNAKASKTLPQTFPFKLDFFTIDRVRSLVGCLLSTYAEVRVLAIELLEQGPSSLPGLSTPEEIGSLDREARESYLNNPRGSQGHAGALALRLVFGLRFGVAGSGRPVDTQGQVKFVNALLDEIDFRLGLSEADIVTASSAYPVHGLLQALQEILALLNPTAAPEIFGPVFHRTLQTIRLAWECTRDVLSSTAAASAGAEDDVLPDHELARAIAKAGEVQTSGSSSAGDVESGPMYQVILSWAWRAVKESSALLAAIYVRPLQESSKPKSPSIWTTSQLEQGGTLFIALLSEIRHPGAFLAIYPDYSKLVDAIVRNTAPTDSASRALPSAWLDIHLEALNVEQHTAGRRSAGLPYGILAVLLGQPALVPRAFEALLELATSESAEVVVTAMNALKVVMSESKLSSFFSTFFERAVITALESLSSPDWAVRNVGLLLMGALVRKAFDAKSQASESILSRDSLSTWSSKYPRLLPLFLRELRTVESDDRFKRSEGSVFAILQVLRNLQASDPPSEEQTAFVAILERLSTSRQLDIREATAHALPAVISRTSLPVYLPQALASACSSATQNELHGRLLQLVILVRDVARPFDPTAEANQAFVAALVGATTKLLVQNKCGPTQALFVQLVGAVQGSTSGLFAAVDEFCARQIEDPTSSTVGVGEDLLKLACARYCLGGPQAAASTGPFDLLLRRSTSDEVTEIALLHLEDKDVPLPSELVSLVTPLALDRNQSQRCRQPALRLLATSGPASHAGGADWEGLMGEFERSTNQPFKEALLPVLGTLAKGANEETTSSRLARLLEIVDASSHEAQSEPTRYSSLLTLTPLLPLLLSTTTTTTTSSYSQRLRTHLLVLRLLQDDDYGIRLLAAALVGDFLGLRKNGVDQEVALRAWWAYLSREGAGEAEFGKRMTKMVAAGLEEDLPLSTLRTSSILFATEPPNTYREPELDVRAAGVALLAFAAPSSSSFNSEDVLARAEAQLQAEDDGASEGKKGWLDPAGPALHLRRVQVGLLREVETEKVRDGVEGMGV